MTTDGGMWIGNEKAKRIRGFDLSAGVCHEMPAAHHCCYATLAKCDPTVQGDPSLNAALYNGELTDPRNSDGLSKSDEGLHAVQNVLEQLLQAEAHLASDGTQCGR